MSETAEKTPYCSNCRTEGAKLRCSICKKVVYCNRQCQREDWRFHKRTCAKPKPKEDEKKKKEEEAKKKAAAKSKPVKVKETTHAVEVDGDDEEILKSVKGYRYFHRELSEEEKKQQADFVPQKVTTTPASTEGDSVAASATTTPAGAVNAAGGDAGAMEGATITPSRVSATSAWNSGATWEERNMTPWAKEHLRTLLIGKDCAIEGGTVTVQDYSDWDGDVQIVVSRGKPRYIYDFKLKLKLDVVTTDGDKTRKAEWTFLEVSNDEDVYETSLAWGKPKPTPLQQAAVKSVTSRKEGGALYATLEAAFKQFVSDFKAK